MSAESADREIRVFLSSTFRDMEAERDWLLKAVFPKVRAACQARSVGFTDIDLRWGVTEEHSQNGLTVEVCLREIDRCRDFPPFFIGFLGERYGWIPSEDKLAAYWANYPDSPYAAPIREAVARGISVTELEMELAVLAEGAAERLAGQALFLLRDRALTAALYRADKGREPDEQDGDYYDAGGGLLDALKARLRASPFLGVDGYRSVEQFGQVIEDYLLEQLERFFPLAEQPTPLQRQQAAHAAFRFQRRQYSLARPDVTDALQAALGERVEVPAHGPLLLSAPSGAGKSVLLAGLAEALERESREDGAAVRWQVLDHYVGADAVSGLDGWIERLLATVQPSIADLVGDWPESPKARREALSTWLTYAARRMEQSGDGVPVRFVLILDALDQLSDAAEAPELLTPATFGPDALLVVSAAEGHAVHTALAAQCETYVLPPFDAALKRELIEQTLARYHKSLLPAQIATLIAAPGSDSPLYLRLVLEKLRLDARRRNVDGLIAACCAETEPGALFLAQFLRDPDLARAGQPDLAVRFMALLSAARRGLEEQALADLLALPDDPPAPDSGRPRLPPVELARLFGALQPLLLNQDERRVPMHRQLGEAALAAAGDVVERERLYAYCAPGLGLSDEPFERRAATEALYQLTRLSALEHPGRAEARARLVAVLGRLEVPLALYEPEPKVLHEALELLEDGERTEMLNQWLEGIAGFDATEADETGEAVVGLTDWLRALAYDRYRLPRRLLEGLLARQEAVLEAANPAISTTLNTLGLLCQYMADYLAVRPFLERALAIREQALGPSHTDTADSLNHLAGYLDETGDPDDFTAARLLYERALAIHEQTSGPKHPGTAWSLNNLAFYLEKTGDPDDFTTARPLYKRALAIREQALGPTHFETAQSLNDLANYLTKTGDPDDFAAVRPLHERTLAIHEQTFGPTHPKTAQSLNNLAFYLQDTGDPDDFAAARPLYERALAISEQAHGPMHPNTAIHLNNLAYYLYETGDPDDFTAARALLERALAISEQAHGPTHPDTARSLNNLAGYLKNTGNPDDFAAARPLLERALAIREQVLGPAHPDTANSLNTLAGYLAKTGDPTDSAAARPLYERALAISEQAHGPMHPETARSLNNLAFYLNDTGDLEDFTAARPLYERVLAISEQAFGPIHPETAISFSNLASYLNETGDPEDFTAARTLYERALAISEQAHGPMHPDTANSLNTLAAHLTETGDPDDFTAARALFERALAIREQVLGPAHLDTANSLDNLAHYLANTSDPDDFAAARTLYERALDIREHVLGSMHPDTVYSFNKLGFYLRNTGDPVDLAAALPLYERTLAIRETRVNQDGWPPVAATLRGLGQIQKGLGDIDAAERTFRRALQINLDFSGEFDSDTVRSLDNLSDMLEKAQRYADALPLRQQQLKILEHLYAPTDPETERVRATLRDLQAAIGQSKDPNTPLEDDKDTDTGLPLTDLLLHWLQEHGWNERPRLDPEARTSSTNFQFQVNDFALDSWFEIAEDAGQFSLFLYYPSVRTPEARLDAVEHFASEVTRRLKDGHLELLREPRVIRFRQTLTVENAAFTPDQISALLEHGSAVMATWIPRYLAVCYGRQPLDVIHGADTETPESGNDR